MTTTQALPQHNSRGLRIITDIPEQGIYLAGFNIAPDVALIRASSFSDAWDVWAEHLASAGSLVECEHDEDAVAFESCDSCDWVDGFGQMVTLDLVLRVIRPGRFD